MNEQETRDWMRRIEELLCQIRNELRSQNDSAETCPYCASTDVENTSVMGEGKRMTCSDCQRSWEE